MAGITREQMLVRVRAAMGDRPREAPHVEFEAARIASPQDMLERFTREAEFAGITVHEASDVAAVAETVGRIVHLAGVKHILLDPAPFPARQEVDTALRSNQSVRVASEPIDDDALFDAEVGIAGARCAIAETGSVVLPGHAQSRRMVSVAPPIHIVIVEAGVLVPDLLDWAAMERSDLRYEVLITGPSKTADIELNLVTGVHGPGTVHVILLRP